MNIPVAHTPGGEISGSIDESVRHAVTKLAHLHFPATELSARRIVAMGEDPANVFNVGCPSIDLVAQTDLGLPADVLRSLSNFGVGSTIDASRPFILMMQHPVTTEYGQSFDQINETLDAVVAVGMQALVFWPNVDAGSEQLAKGIRVFREKGRAAGFHFFRNLPAEVYARLLAHCACVVGNTSSALREGAYLGTPAVTIGTRQTDRETGDNVVRAGYDAAEIAAAITEQVEHGRYEPDLRFGDGTAGTRIADILATARPAVQKKLHYAAEDLLAGAPSP
jgi:UDP-hydrolysing UDP-N-acetyl-D-glucosamine 2-epimerase